MSDTSNPIGSSGDTQDPVQPGGPVPPGAPTGPGGPTEPDIVPDQPNQPGGPGEPSPTPTPSEPTFPTPSEPTTPSPDEPSVPTPSEPTFPDPSEPTTPVPPSTPPGPPSYAGAAGARGSSGATGTSEGLAGSTQAADEEAGDERFERGSDSQGDLGVLAQDVAHPFDQTNGILDDLEGDADEPDRVDSRTGNESLFERAFGEPRSDDFGRNEELNEDETP
ncbi:hypothetical protein ACO2Q7_08910 [Rathayibacter sp. KR2-224]|uniref:hypothetical protein n=1 Tax=Rathayibacter sp. KR2-224 TaxID=3400913 RepID=UPI003C0C5315